MQSGEDDIIILVDEGDNELGTAPKLSSHHGNTPLHRAFSCFAGDHEARVLLTQRAYTKKTFPGVWSNSCCGHAAPGESTEDAVKRRLDEELGLVAEQLVPALPKFRYRAEMDGIVENEICPVYLGIIKGEPKANSGEVANYEWVDWEDFLARLAEEPERFSLWCRLETRELMSSAVFEDFYSRLLEVVESSDEEVNKLK